MMTPNSFQWSKIKKDGWNYYEVGEDEFSYSWESPGVQMTFNEGIPFEKAKKIADEIIKKMIGSGREVQLIALDKIKVIIFYTLGLKSNRPVKII